MNNIDFLFLEFYIQKKYNKKVEEYFNIGKQSVSDWRVSNTIPSKRLVEFLQKEGSMDPLDLIKKLY
jgi:hypothetical protein